jgi:hypothetical protein
MLSNARLEYFEPFKIRYQTLGEIPVEILIRFNIERLA